MNKRCKGRYPASISPRQVEVRLEFGLLTALSVLKLSSAPHVHFLAQLPNPAAERIKQPALQARQAGAKLGQAACLSQQFGRLVSNSTVRVARPSRAVKRFASVLPHRQKLQSQTGQSSKQIGHDRGK